MLSRVAVMSLAVAVMGIGAVSAQAAVIGMGVEVSGGNVFVLPANAANNEGATNNPGSLTEGHVTVTFTNYWTTWSDGSIYGDIDAVIAVGAGQPGIITFTADAGWEVKVVSVDLVGSTGHGAGNIPSLSVGSFSGTNISFNGATHNTLVLNEVGTTVVLTYTNANGDYGWEGLNNIQFVEQEIVIPEPASLGLLGVGALALLKRRRR